MRNMIDLNNALRAQKALRDAAGLPEETFPPEEFIGMISDEIEALRKCGFSDEKIAQLIRDNSDVRVNAAEIAAHYVGPELRHPR